MFCHKHKKYLCYLGIFTIQAIFQNHIFIPNYFFQLQFVASCLALVACQIVNALPRPDGDDSAEFIPILRDDRTHEDGHYSFDIETGDGIVRSEAGQPEGDDGAVHQAGAYS